MHTVWVGGRGGVSTVGSVSDRGFTESVFSCKLFVLPHRFVRVSDCGHSGRPVRQSDIRQLGPLGGPSCAVRQVRPSFVSPHGSRNQVLQMPLGFSLSMRAHFCRQRGAPAGPDSGSPLRVSALRRGRRGARAGIVFETKKMASGRIHETVFAEIKKIRSFQRHFCPATRRSGILLSATHRLGPPPRISRIGHPNMHGNS